MWRLSSNTTCHAIPDSFKCMLACVCVCERTNELSVCSSSSSGSNTRFFFSSFCVRCNTQTSARTVIHCEPTRNWEDEMQTNRRKKGKKKETTIQHKTVTHRLAQYIYIYILLHATPTHMHGNDLNWRRLKQLQRQTRSQLRPHSHSRHQQLLYCSTIVCMRTLRVYGERSCDVYIVCITADISQIHILIFMTSVFTSRCVARTFFFCPFFVCSSSSLSSSLAFHAQCSCEMKMIKIDNNSIVKCANGGSIACLAFVVCRMNSTHITFFWIFDKNDW